MLLTDLSTYGFDYVCTSCILGAEILLQYHRMGWPPGRMISVLASLCSTFKIQAGVKRFSYFICPTNAFLDDYLLSFVPSPCVTG